MPDQKITAAPVTAVRVGAAPAMRAQFVLHPQQFHPLPPPHQLPFLNGPISTTGGATVYNDRYDQTLKWYFPDFSLKTPLTDSFSLKCWRGGVDKDAKPTYAGEAAFTVSKRQPAAVQALARTPGITYREIPLQNLTMAFVVRLFDKTTLPYPTKLVQQGDDYLLTIELESEQSLTSFYKFIADAANKDYCSLEINGSFFGYLPTAQPQVRLATYQAAFAASHLQALRPARPMTMARPADAAVYRPPLPPPPAPPYEAKSGIPFTAAIASVNFDCNGYPQNYLARASDGQTLTAFGCRPPFGGGSAQRFIYEAFNPTRGNLGDKDYGISRIYRNTYNGSFMVIPQRYVIALDQTADPHLLTPAAHLYTSIDLKDAHGVDNSTASFQFGIAAEISDYQVLLIKRLILDNLPSSPSKTTDDIAIAFPQAISDSVKVVFDPVRIPTVLITAMGAYANGSAGSQIYNLQFQNVSIGQGHAEWIAQQVKRDVGFPPPLTATITLAVDAEEEVPQSAIALSLSRICGNGLWLESDSGGNPSLANHTLYDAEVTAYQDTTGETHLAAPIEISANRAAAVIGSGAASTLRYSYVANPDYLNQVLKEIRVVNLDTISDDLIVTNNTGLFDLYKIASIDFVMSIIRPGETDPAKALAVASTTIIKDGVINHVPFTLPVAQYLSRCSAVYSTFVNFRDGRQQANPAALIDDLNSIGKLINLTVSKLNLPPPVSH